MVTINVDIIPPSSGKVEIFNNDESLGVITINSTFSFDVGDIITLDSVSNPGYEFSHYIQPAGNETSNPTYEDTITTTNEKNITVVFDLIDTTKKYSCVDGKCIESENGTYNEPTCNNDCVEAPSENNLSLGLIFGLGVIAWLTFKREKED